MRYFRLSLCVFAAGLMVSACGSRKGGSSAAPAPTTTKTSYYEADGVCYRASTNTEVSSNNCNSLKFVIEAGECLNENGQAAAISQCTSNTYFVSGNRCYDRQGTEVAFENCDRTASSGNSGSGTCSGIHYFFDDDGTVYEVNCDGRTGSGNCSEYVLFEPNAQSFVQCR